MSERVIELKGVTAKDDALLKVVAQDDWSAMRSAHSGRDIYAYSVLSNSGKHYEVEVFRNNAGELCGVCQCDARLACRHIRAVMYDLEKRKEKAIETAEEVL